MSYPRFTDIARAFAPGWFAAVMGTGVFAITTHSLSLRWPWLALPAEMLHWFYSVEKLAEIAKIVGRNSCE